MGLFKKLPLPSKPKPNLEAAVQLHLSVFEEAEKNIQELRSQNEEVFTRLAELETAKNDSVEALKRILYTKDGPPDGRKFIKWAEGEYFTVEVQYKKHADYYDPALIPVSVLMMPGIVTEVDTERCKQLANEGLEEVMEAAKVTGAWMTPAVSVKRR